MKRSEGIIEQNGKVSYQIEGKIVKLFHSRWNILKTCSYPFHSVQCPQFVTIVPATMFNSVRFSRLLKKSLNFEDNWKRLKVLSLMWTAGISIINLSIWLCLSFISIEDLSVSGFRVLYRAYYTMFFCPYCCMVCPTQSYSVIFTSFMFCCKFHSVSEIIFHKNCEKIEHQVQFVLAHSQYTFMPRFPWSYADGTFSTKIGPNYSHNSELNSFSFSITISVCFLHM